MLANIMGPDLLIVLGVVVLLFGGSQLPKLARSLGTHAVVRARCVEERPVFSAVFPALPAGRYRICACGTGMLTIAGGEVTEANWPG